MNPPKTGPGGFGVLGVGVAACCAGPILVFLGGLSLAGLASTLLIGGFGFAVAVLAAAAVVVVRRRRSRAVDDGPVPVPVAAAPGRRS